MSRPITSKLLTEAIDVIQGKPPQPFTMTVHPQYYREAKRLRDKIPELKQHYHLMTVVRLVGEGLSNKEIGDQIFLSESTVKAHVSSIYRILDITPEDRNPRVLLGRMYFLTNFFGWWPKEEQ